MSEVHRSSTQAQWSKKYFLTDKGKEAYLKDRNFEYLWKKAMEKRLNFIYSSVFLQNYYNVKFMRGK